MSLPNRQRLNRFITEVMNYYAAHSRDLPWRKLDESGGLDPYAVLVSEMMLQQTQVSRVIPKYEAFLQQFPTLHSLAAAEQSEVLRVWSGLGYNRRARYLHQAAKQLVTLSSFPRTILELERLPGIGHNTAAAVLVYTFNQPETFVETNIRTVLLHHFFAAAIRKGEKIPDCDLLPILLACLPRQRAREWYWALMDYGSYLKQTVGNASKHSQHYKKQSSFSGSKRQLRGAIVRLLLQEPFLLVSDIEAKMSDARTRTVLDDLERESLAVRIKTAQGEKVRLAP